MLVLATLRYILLVFSIFFVVFLDTINLPCTVIDGEFWFWSSDWETFLSVMSLPAKDEKCSVSNALWQIWCRKQKNELCTAWTYDKVIDEKRSNSTHSKPFTMARTRFIKCFVLQHNEIKTKQLRSSVCMRRHKLWSEMNQTRHNVNAWMYLQPHYSNGVFGNIYLSARQH